MLAVFLPTVTRGATNDAIVRIPRGADASVVRDSIARYLGDDYASQVMKVARFSSTDFSRRHGAYLIPEGMSPMKAARKLSKGAQEPVRLTINGFRSLGRLAERVARRVDVDPDSLVAYLNSEEVAAKYGLTPEQALSLFIDDSYEVYWSASPADIAAKVGRNYEKVWNKERVAKASTLGLTPAEVMTICSIVDEETNDKSEKGKVGRLYINRLKIGMPLQADPTIRFALDDFTIKRVKGEHLKVDSPYNTYLHRGLPPGPIRTTSVATIDSVLDSEPSEDLYMCAKEDFSGSHNFASSYSQHLENARRYRMALDERGIQ